MFKKKNQPKIKPEMEINPLLNDHDLIKYLDKFQWRYDAFYHCYVLSIEKIIQDSLMIGAFIRNDFSMMQIGKEEDLILIKKVNDAILHKWNKESRAIQRAEIQKERDERTKEQQYLIKNRDKILKNLLESKDCQYRYHINKKHEVLTRIPKPYYKDKSFLQFYMDIQTRPQTINGKEYKLIHRKITRTYPEIEIKNPIKYQTVI